MCGLLGFASSEVKGGDLKKNFFLTGFPMIAVDRGMDSSGLAVIPTAGTAPRIYKRALWGGDFIQNVQTRKLIDSLSNCAVALGHVRAATRGTATDDNAHPFNYDHITLVHNGHIRNAHQLPHSQAADNWVDSAIVAHSMAKNGVTETLEEVEGPFCFIWWDSKEQSLSIARNTDRPLYIGYIEKENTMFWASELTQLLHLLRSAKIDEEIGILWPKAMIHYKYDLKDLRVPKQLPFAKSQGWQQSRILGRHDYRGNGTGRTGETEKGDDWETNETVSSGTTTQTSSTGTSRRASGSSEIDEIREQIRNTRSKDIKASGYPTSPKRINRATRELGKLQIKFGEMRVCRPLSWAGYRNQDGRRGSILAEMNRGAYLVEILDMTPLQYAEIADLAHICVDCVNVRYRAGNKLHIISILSDNTEALLQRRRTKKNETIADLGEPALDYDGPGGRKVSLAKFRELVVHGCQNCQRQIEAEEHGTVMWIGTPAAPICRDCSTPELLESLGFPDHLKDVVH